MLVFVEKYFFLSLHLISPSSFARLVCDQWLICESARRLLFSTGAASVIGAEGGFPGGLGS